ncbi:hypothetical protein [Dactylosporangium sp. CA-092794]|uniref:hypothetical protein n=1 Tax=Dactylosporangium sp. CA-092794 TaxID=3239929 RepID=UPI003D90D6D5
MTTPDPEREDDSVLGRLPSASYDPDTVAAFELTQQLLRNAIGVCSARRWELEHPGPDDRVDPGELSATIAAQSRFADLLRDLDLDDPARVAQIREECAAFLREAYQR